MPILGIINPLMGMPKHTAKTAHRRPARGGRQLPNLERTGLADALFTSTQQRVLALLYGQPERSFYATELIEKTGSGSGAVQRELRRLSDSGLVSMTRLGNQTHYQANAGAPIYSELRGIVEKTIGVTELLKAALASLATRIRFAAVYGSLPRRTDGALSDVDVLIVGADLTLEEVYGVVGPVEKRIARAVSPTLYTPEEFQRRRETGQAFLKKVLSGPHIVLMGREDAVDSARYTRASGHIEGRTRRRG
jgi:predicted nucleotidyltransferase